MKEFMDSIELNDKFLGFNDKLFEISLDFPHPPFYNELFDIWGLDEE